jgi:hypothetical protein
MDNQQWTNVHVYIMKDWHQFPILLTLEHVEANATIYNIIAILLKCMAKYGQLLVEKLGSRWVCIGCDKNSMFQGIKVTSQLKSRVIPFLISLHCMAHKINLTIVVLSKLHWCLTLSSCRSPYFHSLHTILKS